MSKEKKDKRPFDWTPGSRLDDTQYEPLGKVREVGFSKMADGLYADPEKRKKARKAQLSKNLKAKILKDQGIEFEVSSSQELSEMTPSHVEKLIPKDDRWKGIQRFGDRSGVNKKPE